MIFDNLDVSDCVQIKAINAIDLHAFILSDT